MSYQIKNGEIVAKDTEGHTRKFPKANVDVVISECRRLGINNKYLIAGILAVISKESGFVPKNENLNYSESGLKNTFGSYFNPSRAKAAEYAKKPEKIANYVYGGTWNGNKYSLGRYGNTVQGDGFKYRGRGFNQITFKSGYEKYQKLSDSLKIKPWSKADFDNNGLTDILVIGNLRNNIHALIILDKGNQYEINRLTKHYFQNPKIMNQLIEKNQNQLLVYHRI